MAMNILFSITSSSIQEDNEVRTFAIEGRFYFTTRAHENIVSFSVPIDQSQTGVASACLNAIIQNSLDTWPETFTLSDYLGDNTIEFFGQHCLPHPPITVTRS